jgi:hypothetical protein
VLDSILNTNRVALTSGEFYVNNVINEKVIRLGSIQDRFVGSVWGRQERLASTLSKKGVQDPTLMTAPSYRNKNGVKFDCQIVTM